MEETESRWRDPWALGLALWGAFIAVAAFPPGVFGALALVGPTPLWLGALRASPGRAFWRGWLYGLGFFLSLIWWLVPTVTRYGNLPLPVGVACLALLAGYLALSPAAAAWACAAGARRGASAGLVVAPLAWTGLEWVRGWLLSGFPWGDLPQALWQSPWALALAPWVGIDGARLLVASASSGFAWLAASVLSRQRLPWRGLLPAAAAGLLGASLLTFPVPLAPTSGRVTVGVVQGNIDQAQKWDPEFRRSTLRIYSDLTRSLAQRGADFVLWPETAVPLLAQEPGPGREILAGLARTSDVWLAFGAPAYSEGQRGVEYRNAVFLMDPSGRLRDRYDKVHLVPFGEYVPLGRFFPFLKKMVEGVGDFTSGPSVRPLSSGGALPSLGPLVCFEVIFPDLASRHLEAGAQLLTVVTNDGWFGKTPAPYQHLAFAAWRAAETGLPLVRAANTGVSAVFDARGRLLTATALQARDAFTVGLDVAAPHTTPQVSVRPWVSPLCLILAAGGLFAILRRPRLPEPAKAQCKQTSRNRRDEGSHGHP